MEIKILIADDDPMFLELVSDIVRKEKFTPVVAHDGQEALDLFWSTPDFALVILDVMMPKVDGWAVLQEIRELSQVPILMLTALGDVRYEVKGLQKGADDYIAKPFGYEIFVARVRALLRKAIIENQSQITIGALNIHQASQSVQVSGEDVFLNRKEYQVLLYLIHNPNQVISREQLINQIWGYDFDGDVRTVDTHMKTLRAKLLHCGEMIKTVRGSGYLFEGK